MGIGSYFPYFLYIVQPVDIDPSDTSLFDKGQRLLGGAYFLGKERAIRVGADIFLLIVGHQLSVTIHFSLVTSH